MINEFVFLFLEKIHLFICNSLEQIRLAKLTGRRKKSPSNYTLKSLSGCFSHRARFEFWAKYSISFHIKLFAAFPGPGEKKWYYTNDPIFSLLMV